MRPGLVRSVLVAATVAVSVLAGLTIAGTPVFGKHGRLTSKRVLFSKCAADRHGKKSRHANGPPPGGDWPMYSHDWSNTRNQDREHLIGPGNVSKLGPVWTFSTKAAGAHGDFVGTPVVAGGCVYAGTAGGFIFAINADNGKLVWRQKVTGDINNSLAVHKGVVYAGVTDTTYQPCGGRGCDGPYVAAFDARTGKRLWKTLPVDTQQGTDIYSSPVIYDPGGSSTSRHRGRRAPACAAALRLRVRLRVPKGQRLRTVRVYLGRHLTRRLHGRQIGKPLVLRRPSGRFTVRLLGVTNRGNRVRRRLRFGGCKNPPLLIEGISAWAAEGEHSLAQEGPRASYEGSVIILNALNGKLLKKVWTIHPPANGSCPASTCPKGVNDHFAGAPVWSSAAIDPRAKVAYVATGNPYQPEAESDHSNAILKIGIDQRDRATFGQVIASAKGTPDTYASTPQGAPCVNPPTVLDACLQQDLDFGASPNLYTDAKGRQVVGDGQKSGVYHAFDRGTMAPLWHTVVGPPSLVGGIVGTSAYGDHNLYGSITENGGLWSLDATSGTSRWSNKSLQDGEHYGTPMSYANGIAYTTTNDGHVAALDPATGDKLANLSLSQGTQTGSDPVSTYGGVALARHTVYAAVGIQGNPAGFIIAYRLGGKGSPPPDTAPRYPDASANSANPSDAAATIIAPPGAQTAGFATPAVTIRHGQLLAFRNLDGFADHNVTAQTRNSSGKPLFRSENAGANVTSGSDVIVTGAEKLAPGTYPFYCSIHPSMTGTLTVNP